MTPIFLYKSKLMLASGQTNLGGILRESLSFSGWRLGTGETIRKSSF
jgi:hypothetical protein